MERRHVIGFLDRLFDGVVFGNAQSSISPHPSSQPIFYAR